MRAPFSRPFLPRTDFLAVGAAFVFLACGRSDEGDSPLRSAPPNAVPAVTPSSATEPAADALDAAIVSFFEAGGNEATDRYETASLDLDGDGRDDGLVFVYDPEWCGSGGCTLLVFQGTDAGSFRLVSETSLVNGPIVVSERRTNGWRDIVVPDPLEDRTLALQHGASGYPSEPEGPAVSRPAGETVFEGELGLF